MVELEKQAMQTIPPFNFVQSKIISKVKPILEESMKSLYCNSVPSCFRVADLGCSSGPNALQAAYDVIDVVHNISRSYNREPPITFQIYLNDQFQNDFNNIFEALPCFYERLREEKGEGFGACFVNATPGSFYGRLFPTNSMHFFHSSTSLHWLSQAPKGLINKENIYFTNTSPCTVYQAYLDQFSEDFNLFLKSRAEELVHGGGMVLTFVGRDETSDIITPWGLIGLVLNDMVLESLIEEAKLESVHMPRYGPTADEVKQLIDAEGRFILEKLETFKSGWDEGLKENGNSDMALDVNVRANFIAKYVRATTEPFLTSRFGEGIIDELFLRFGKKVAKLLEEQKLEYTYLVMFMTKK
ncbi:probable jasmonic acid carboxyl methyltransferase 2 isoform X2 [Vigna angularis]|uniref:probable jasmonic acid carboxyl methyltransferase 2 isoform X2 n=1 Tax=Phaseolus angularis TaxID=3914 RepID=UPI00080A03DA|nr:probable jasmonic acid carboxyl methyltransferase 2 isoform X2 [Vigna angularis]